MKRILITGATGNVGKEVINSLLHDAKEATTIVAGVRDVEKDKKHFGDAAIEYIHFDFEDESTFESAFLNCNILFLLRPPQISNVKRYFAPLISSAQKCKVEHIVFLSVQGVESSKFIPHHKIEKLIVESKVPYTFIRPAYFMQNFTTTLHEDLIKKQLVFLPAGKAKFTVIDTADIGLATAAVLLNTHEHRNKSYDLTNEEKLTFGEMTQKISAGTGKKIRYESPNLVKFFLQKRNQKVPAVFILVMIMLHYLPRFRKEPETTDCARSLSGRSPKTFHDFVKENRSILLG